MPETRKRHVPSSSGSTSPTHNSVSSSGPNKDEASRSFSHTLGLLIIFISLSCVTTLYLLPSPIEPIEYSLPLPPEFIGPLAENKLLAKADKLFLDRLRGPESITVHNGKLFTGTADGQILEINGDDIRVVATLGKPPCGKFDDEPTCGRPLGMRFDKDGSLVVVDAYLGLFRVNVETGKFVQLYSPETLVDGEQAAFLNDLDIDSDGTVYFTDSSTNWGRRYNRYAAMEAKKNGRLLAYNPNIKRTEVILKNMSFPNGVQLSPEKDFILIAELCTCKILQYHTKGPRKGEVEIFSDNLPGAPDNIRPSSSGGYWVGLATTRRAGKFSLLDYTSTKPWMKKLIFKVFSQEFLLKMIPKYGLVIELDASGNIIRSLHDPSGEDVPNVSEVEDDNGVLYFGSYYLPYIGRLKLQS